MFDIKLYDETGERETIRGLTWVQMTTVQSVIARLHFLLGNKQYKHKSNQVADENELAKLRSELEQVDGERDAAMKLLARADVAFRCDLTQTEAWEYYRLTREDIAAALKGAK